MTRNTLKGAIGAGTLALLLGGTALPVAAQDKKVTVTFVSFTQDITDMYGQILRGMQAKLDESGVAYDLRARFETS